jgi:uncharacterized protein YjbI with pentapeptide repeats
MADKEHLKLLEEAIEKKDISIWNEWRERNTAVRPDLREGNLRSANLSEANLNSADLRGAGLGRAFLKDANLCDADLRGADLCDADLWGTLLIRANLSDAIVMFAILTDADLRSANLNAAVLCHANLTSADLRQAELINTDLRFVNLSNADLEGADLRGADLGCTSLVETNLENAILIGCRIYGISAWGLKLKGAKQSDLIITPAHEPNITVDNLEVAQFIYLLLNNEKIRDVIDTITSKVVLILGRFGERKQILDRLRDALRNRNYSPILFDFTKPSSRSTDETIMLLARMARFVIADITDAKSVLQELRGIVPDCPSVPIQPLLINSQIEPGMFDYFHQFHWFLQTYQYQNEEQLLIALDSMVIEPAEAKANQIRSTEIGR